MGNVTIGQFSSMERKQMVAVGESRKGEREGRERRDRGRKREIPVNVYLPRSIKTMVIIIFTDIALAI